MSKEDREFINRLPRTLDAIDQESILDPEILNPETSHVLTVKKESKPMSVIPLKLHSISKKLKRHGRKKFYAKDPNGVTAKAYSRLARKAYGPELSEAGYTVEGRSCEPSRVKIWKKSVHDIKTSWAAYEGGTEHGRRVPCEGDPKTKSPFSRSLLMSPAYEGAYEDAGITPKHRPPKNRQPTVEEMKKIIALRDKGDAAVLPGIIVEDAQRPQKVVQETPNIQDLLEVAATTSQAEAKSSKPSSDVAREMLRQEAADKHTQIEADVAMLTNMRAQIGLLEDKMKTSCDEFKEFVSALSTIGVDVSDYRGTP